MNIKELENKLSKTTEGLKYEIKSRSAELKEVTPEDFEYLGRQVYYTFTEFKDDIIKYLKENK